MSKSSAVIVKSWLVVENVAALLIVSVPVPVRTTTSELRVVTLSDITMPPMAWMTMPLLNDDAPDANDTNCACFVAINVSVAMASLLLSVIPSTNMLPVSELPTVRLITDETR